MRENHAGGMPREPGEVLCGREIDARFLVQLHASMANIQLHLMSRKQWNEGLVKDFGAIFCMLSSIPHLRFHDLERFTVDRVAINFNARKAFVANSLTLPKFKQTILRNHVISQKNENIAQIIHAVIQAATDIAFRFHHEIHAPVQEWQHIVSLASLFANELFNLKAYANQELALIHHDFHSSPSKILFLATWDFKLINIVKNDTRSFAATTFPPFTPQFRR
jgi:hypothetical protein